MTGVVSEHVTGKAAPSADEALGSAACPGAPSAPQSIGAPEAAALATVGVALAELKSPLPESAAAAPKDIPLVVSASEPLEQILAGAESLVRCLKLPDKEGAEAVKSIEELRRSITAPDGQPHLRELLGKLLLLSPDVLAITAQHQAEASAYSAAPYQHTQVKFAGMTYLYAELVEQDPMLASALVSKYDHRPAARHDLRDLHAKLAAFYKQLAHKEDSPLGGLVHRELEDTNTIGATAFLAGIMSPIASVDRDVSRTLFERIAGWLQPAVPTSLRDLAVCHPVSKAMAQFLKSIDPPAAAEKPAEAPRQDAISPAIAELVCVALPQAASAAQKTGTLLGLLKLIQRMQSCSDEELYLLLNNLAPDKAFTHTDAMSTATAAINALPSSERIASGSWSDGGTQPITGAIMVEALARISPQNIADLARFDVCLPQILAFLDEACSDLKEEYRKEVHYLCTKRHTDLVLLAHAAASGAAGAAA